MRRLVLLLLLVVGCTACGDDIQFADPPTREPAQRAVHDPHAGMRAAGPAETPAGAEGEAGEDPFADPEEEDATPETGEAAGPRIYYEGTIELPEGFQLPSSYAVFVSAYVPGGRVPALTRRYEKPSFPLHFQLTDKNAPFGAAPWDKEYTIGVIFSERGDVLPGGGKYSKTLHDKTLPPGTKDIVLRIKD